MFKIETYLNTFLPVGSTRVDAVFSIASDGSVPVTTRPKTIIGFIVDNSGSMDDRCGGNSNNKKIHEAKTALRLSIDMLTEDQQFFVILFNSSSKVIIGPCFANRENKHQSHEIIQRIEANGGTCMSAALALAREQITRIGEGAVCQVYFLTDGQNNDGDNSPLRSEVLRCAGKFQAHCRGVGTDWSPSQLRVIAEGLLGTVDIIARPEKLKEDFENTLKSMTSKTISEVRLELFTPKLSKITMFKQGYPTEIDLTSKLRQKNERTSDFLLGSWGSDIQEYCATFEVVPGEAGQEVLVCRPKLIYIDPLTGQNKEIPSTNVTVKWTEDVSLSARINEQVAHYTGQAEKAKAIQEGLEALAKQDIDVATVKLGRAMKLATESGDEGTVKRLRQVVDVVDADAGTVKVKRNVSKEETMNLDVASTRTVRANRVK